MKKEQEKAITVLEKYKQECIEEYKIELDDKDNIDQPRAFYLHQQIEAVYIVLNMLKEKDREIEKKDKRLKRQFNLLTKKDKIIYEMIGSFIDIGFGFEYCNNDDRCINDCDKCIKKYFERKSKE